jgi:hypothetical protein
MMKPLTPPARKVVPLLCIVAVAAALGSLITCESPSQPSNEANPAVGAAFTSIQVRDPLAATKQAFDQQQQQRADQMRTADILSHVLTHIPGPPPTDTPGVPPTPTSGVALCPTLEHGYPYVYRDCWLGLVNGQVLFVATAYTPRHQVVNGKGYDVQWVGDDTQGVVIVDHSTDEAVYNTPLKVGVMGILSVNGTQLTLAPVNPNDRRYLLTGPTIIFDIATRQFISASGTPIPATPVPTPAP